MASNFKEGGDQANLATQIAAGGSADADAVAVGGAGILGAVGGTGVAAGGQADADAANAAVQSGFAGGTTDNIVNSGNVRPIITWL
jgi:hypothetical protein